MSTTATASPASATNTPLNKRIVLAFIEGIQSVYATMLATKVSTGVPFLKTDQTGYHDVSGVIGFSGGFSGSVTLCFNASTAEKSVAAFAGMEMKLGTPDFADAVGELTNMVAGAAKSLLNGNASISTPVVVIGNSHSIPRLKDVPSIVIPCATALGEFTIEVNMKQQPQAPAH